MAHISNEFPRSGPGSPPLSAESEGRLRAAYLAKAQPYHARTRHLDGAGAPLFYNRLLGETSPYLEQHAHNPVNWYPWGDEAFAMARALKRPVLLSVGYATCHWCHVMEEESFEDLAVAELINSLYIPVKVDREERPDVDAVYMACVQAWSGQGGWPMTVWLTPERKPFFGGTYFPPRDGARGARVGFATLLSELAQTYAEQPERVEQATASVIEAVTRRQLAAPAGTSELPGEDVLDNAMRYYQRTFDKRRGGVGGAPKFPSSLPIRFLLRYSQRRSHPEALAMAELTLNNMAGGGIYDHAAGGFHRYAVDDSWLVPHFEKMLYDNALLAVAYTEAWQLTKNAAYKAVACEILDYVRREMTAPTGGFYSATDADSRNPHTGEREEGWFFTWTPDELHAALGSDLARVATAYFGVVPEGHLDGRSILHTPRPLAAVADELNLNVVACGELIDQIKQTLRHERSKRPVPLRDDKIITGWNGLMISAFAKGAMAFQSPRYLALAAAAATCLRRDLYHDGRLSRCFKESASTTAAFLEDYALLIQGLLDLYEASGTLPWLEWAVALDSTLNEEFSAEDGAYYMSSVRGEQLLYRDKPSYDGAVPSGNSVHAHNLLRLAALTGQEAFAARADALLKVSSELLHRAPAAVSEMLLAVDFRLDEPRQIMVVEAQAPGHSSLLSTLGQEFVPNRVLAVASESALAEVARLIPMMHDKRAIHGKTTAYVCRRMVCKLPVQESSAFLKQLS